MIVEVNNSSLVVVSFESLKAVVQMFVEAGFVGRPDLSLADWTRKRRQKRRRRMFRWTGGGVGGGGG